MPAPARGSVPSNLEWVPTIVDDQRGTIPGPAAAVSAYGALAGRKRYIRVPQVADFTWLVGSNVVRIMAEPDAEPYLVLDAIQGVGTPLFLQSMKGYEVLHGSAVATDFGVVGFCGYSGDGKSTLAHAYSLGGNELWADDLVAFRIVDGKAVATALPFRPVLRAESQQFLAQSRPVRRLSSRAVEPWSCASVRALFVLDPNDPPRSSNATFDVVRLGGADAITALLPHGLRLLPLDKERERGILTAYVDLVACVPVFRLEYTRSFAVLPALVEHLEQELG